MIQQVAAISLGNMGPKAKVAVPALTKLLKDKNPAVRQCAAQSRGASAPRRSTAVPALIELLKDEDSTVRLETARGLGGIGPAAKAAVPALMELATSKDGVVRKAELPGLGELAKNKDAAVLKGFVDLFANMGQFVRADAVRAVGQIGPAAAVPTLTELLKDKSWAVQHAAIFAIGSAGTQAKAAIPVLAEVAEGKHRFCSGGRCRDPLRGIQPVQSGFHPG